jgi:hypothetical protein
LEDGRGRPTYSEEEREYSWVAPGEILETLRVGDCGENGFLNDMRGLLGFEDRCTLLHVSPKKHRQAESASDRKHDVLEAAAAAHPDNTVPSQAPATKIVGGIVLGGMQSAARKHAAMGKLEVCALDQTAEAEARSGKPIAPNMGAKKTCAKVTGDSYELVVPAGSYMVFLSPLYCFHGVPDEPGMDVFDPAIFAVAKGSEVKADINACSE